LDKPQAANELKQALEAIPRLRSLNYRNAQLDGWLNGVSQVLETAYGKNSPELQRFSNAAGVSFKVWTEYGQEQEYQRQLDCYEETLKAIAGIK